MYLKKINISGFKSFVDPTIVHFPGNLIGIVGPNGCGKSNVIDAVKWVMGESSAKTLRSETMADVIFNGSANRKPVGIASVELIFDNREGKLGGQYAGFNEISVKRIISRDGSSQYSLNGTKCRRRDITDIFLGTGLGARSYAIIEQGMVSRLIEAKPEELRIYLEEAAGISKYKERRRETENRIKHTRENLERLTDLREELTKQLDHLKRQSEAAEKYKAFKQSERTYKSELLALRWQSLEAQLTQHEQVIREKENTLESVIADQRGLETDIEGLRQKSAEASDAMSAVQARFYHRGSKITRLEEAIKYAHETHQQRQEELERLQKQLTEVSDHLQQGEESLTTIETQLSEGEPKLQRVCQQQEISQESLSNTEKAMQRWQEQWETHQSELFAATQSIQVEMTRIDHIQRHSAQLQERLTMIEDEQKSLDEASMGQELKQLQKLQGQLSEKQLQLQLSLEQKAEEITQQRLKNNGLEKQQEDIRDALQQNRAELTTLQAVQKAAYGGSNEQLSSWLTQQGLNDAPRMAQGLNVEAGWEQAVEATLGHYLEAVCVDNDASHAMQLDTLKEGRVSLVCQGPVAEAPDSLDDRLLVKRVNSSSDIAGLLHQVYTADNLSQALAMRNSLPDGASIVTRDGICLGRSWVHVSVEHSQEGILQREHHIKRLERDMQRLENEYQQVTKLLQQSRETYQKLEQGYDTIQNDINILNQQLVESRAEINSHENSMRQTAERAQRLATEVNRTREQIDLEKKALGEADTRLAFSRTRQQVLEEKRESLSVERESYIEDLGQKRHESQEINGQVHQLTAQMESLRNQRDSIQQHHERMLYQQRQIYERQQQLQQSMSNDIPLDEMESQRKTLLEERQITENELKQARQLVEKIDYQMREQERRRHQTEQVVQKKRAAVEQTRMAWQEIKTRCQSIAEQLAELQQTAEELLKKIDPEATEQTWVEELTRIERRITHLGAINLAAIDEYKASSERKEYLDKQNNDLTEALETLETAIRKIDRETRTRFKSTFDQVNAGMKKIFPRLFGGGSGYLKLNGEDLLETGVSVMAHPPGKQNSSIHLLSGGEKAMTAVSLLFSLFQLNPAPFCMLDEVDAPLDDANIGRFCEVVTEMSKDIQFIVVTHSKATMEMTNQLMGVTMQEPGVSRLVTVDMDEAVQIAS